MQEACVGRTYHLPAMSTTKLVLVRSPSDFVTSTNGFTHLRSWVVGLVSRHQSNLSDWATDLHVHVVIC